MSPISRTLFSLVALLLGSHVAGHGYMIEPAQRGSMWRTKEYPAMNDPDYNDNSLNAGGAGQVLQDPANPKYGMCGDPFSQPTPRAHESGGRWGKFHQLGQAAVARCYKPGEEIEIHLEITANHKGFNEFQLCVLEEGQNESEDCFQRGPKLEQVNGKGPVYTLPSTANQRFTDLRYRIPSDISCEGKARCVLRWYWKTNNSPGSHLIEEFWNCADIQVGTSCASAGGPVGSSAPSMSVATPAIPSKPVAAAAPAIVQPTPALPTASISASTGNKCGCTEGKCDNGVCTNCLTRFAVPGGEERRVCYEGWQEWQCDIKSTPAQSYTWCGN